jgi:hypothetical protein
MKWTIMLMTTIIVRNFPIGLELIFVKEAVIVFIKNP